MDAHCVMAGDLVSRLEGVGEGGHGLAVCVLHQPTLRTLFLHDVAEVAGVGEELVRVRRPRHGRGLAAASQHPVDGLEKIERTEGLSDQRVGARVPGFLVACLSAGQDDHARQAEDFVLLQLPAERETARALQVHVQHDQRRPPEARDRRRFLGGGGLLDRILVRGERGAQQQP